MRGGYWNQLVIKLSRKVVFLVVERHLQLENAGKHISATTEFQNFPGDHDVPPPPPPGEPTLCPGVKPSRPPVQNLNETPALEGKLKLKGSSTAHALYPVYTQYTLSLLVTFTGTSRSTTFTAWSFQFRHNHIRGLLFKNSRL